MTRSDRRLVWEIGAVLIFKALFLWGIWACCFRQVPAPAPTVLFSSDSEVRHGIR